MAFFKAALTQVNKLDVAIIWLDTKYLDDDDEIKKEAKFFKELLDCPNVVIMILDEEEKPVYYGYPSIVDILKRTSWKKYPWKSYELGKTVTEGEAPNS